jgi:hypothetical protein
MSGSEIRSSVPLQICLYFHDYYVYLSFLVSILLYIVKSKQQQSSSLPANTSHQYISGMKLPYPAGILGLEISFLVVYLLVEKVRIRIASRGNKTEQVVPSGASLLLAILSAIVHIYFIQLQTYA